MKRILSLLISVSLMLTAYCQADPDSTNLLKTGSDMPEFTLTSIDGKSVSSDDLYGKVVLVNFFATWCAPCNLELPVMEKEIWAKYRSNPDFVLLIVDREEKIEKVKAFVEKKKWTMPFYLDEKKEVYSLFATKFIPRNYLFDREGTLVLNSKGFEREDMEVLNREISSLLSKKR
jgi:peroxiredoxin